MISRQQVYPIHNFPLVLYLQGCKTFPPVVGATLKMRQCLD